MPPGWDWIAIAGLALTAIGTILAWLTYAHDHRTKEANGSGADAPQLEVPRGDAVFCPTCGPPTDTPAGTTGRVSACPICGATVWLPDGTGIRVEGRDADEVSKVARDLLGDPARKRRGRRTE